MSITMKSIERGIFQGPLNLMASTWIPATLTGNLATMGINR